MRSAKSVGRIIGVMFLVQALLAPLVYFRLMLPGTAPDFLSTAAASAFQVRVGVLITFVLGGLTLAIAIVALPVFRRHSERMAFAFLALSAVGLATLAIESIAIRDMLSLSLEFAKGGANGDVLQTLGGLARTTRAAAHFTNLMIAHGTVFLIYCILFRFALVPRALAALGMAASLVSTTGVTMPLLGLGFTFTMIAPLGLSQLMLIAWLIWRGFAEPEGKAAEVRG